MCALQIDEMEIKKHLEYDRRSGQVYGFTDIGAGMPFSLMHVIICFIVSFTVYIHYCTLGGIVIRGPG